MKIDIISPVAPDSKRGNGVTVRRWAEILKSLGHDTEHIEGEQFRDDIDCVVAIHSTRTSERLKNLAASHPNVSLVVCVAGTDLHRDLKGLSTPDEKRLATRAVELADRIILLEPESIKTIPDASLRESAIAKSAVIYQSAKPFPTTGPPAESTFEVTLIGHLRPIKDPFRAAKAVELLPSDSRIRIQHLGDALTPEMKTEAEQFSKSNPKYTWVGLKPYEECMRQLTRSRLTILTSRSESGPSIVSEAIVNRVPILSTRIAGVVGLLGEDYHGYFDVGQTEQLAELLSAAENDPSFLDSLQSELEALRPRFLLENEADSWASLLKSLSA